MNEPPGDHLEHALLDEGFRREPQQVGADLWWHDDLGHAPDDRGQWLTTGQALHQRGEWETELHEEAKRLGYMLHIDMDGQAAERARGSGRWAANLTPLAGAPTGVGILGDGSTPLGAARDVVARAGSG